ncbi:MAG: V-type ATP synthase subunit D [Firmicutes bacterium]|nr:V-type ATP synthase subunit D [Bacillota bacterium]
MPTVNVNPTRMELKKLKGRLATARHGHKLLKDKRDELMKLFLDVVREEKELRASLEVRYANVQANFAVAAAAMNEKMLTEALLLPKSEGTLSVSEKNLMSVSVPCFSYDESHRTDGCGYGFAFTSGELDFAVESLSGMTADLIKLAELEKSAELLADEIEKTRRRVNALESIMIPDIESSIRSISMKLDENERGNTTRLMKIKDIMVAEQMEARRSADAKI